MKNLIVRLLCASFLYVMFSSTVQSQVSTVAILDQGYNDNLIFKAKNQFRTQHCFSFSDHITGSAPPFQLVNSTNYTNMFASLCRNGQPFQAFAPSAAQHPRRVLDPLVNSTFYTSKFLDHSQVMSNSIWDFDSSLFQQHVQVFGLSGNRRAGIQTPTDIWKDTLSYTTGRGRNVVRALDFMVRNQLLEIGAVSIATVISSSTTPIECIRGDGQDEVTALVNSGVAVVAGLRNNNITAGTESWPNCLDGVINVARTDGYNGQFSGNGIGNNRLDFYAKSRTEHKDNSNATIISFGNSFAAPKVAAAFAALHKADRSATVDQKYRALDQASTRSYSFQGFNRRRIASNQINDAIARLSQIIIEDNQPLPPSPPPTTGDPNDIFFNPIAKGTRFGGEATDTVDIPIDFSSVAAATTTTASSIVGFVQGTADGRRDINLTFTGDLLHDFTLQRTFRILLNGEELFRTNAYPRGVSETRTYKLNRNLFLEGDNLIEIVPASGTSQWGVKDVIVSINPAIPLPLGVTDPNYYGYSRTPPRFTGARFEFDMTNLDDKYQFDITGWDIDRPDETQVFLNGTSLGFLTQGPSDQDSEPDTFVLDKSLLRVGTNTIELEQRRPDSSWSLFQDEKWAVRNISISPKLASDATIVPIIMLLLDEDNLPASPPSLIEAPLPDQLL